MQYDINDPNLCGPQTWAEIGSPLQPSDVARYELDTPYHPDKANMDWEVTSISVLLIGPNTQLLRSGRQSSESRCSLLGPSAHSG